MFRPLGAFTPDQFSIRLPANRILQERIGHLLTRPIGRPPNEVRRSYANFTYQVVSWTKPRRYWARAKAGPYTVLATHITATEAYRYETQILYMLAKEDEIVADDDVRVSFETERVATDGKTGKPVADITRYTYRDDDARYVVTFERQKTILQAILTERAPFIKRLIAKIVGFDGAYHRFTGKVTIEKFEKDVRVEIFDDHAIWELMYFGKARSPTL